MENQNYTMRKLKTKDIFAMSRILGKIDIDFTKVNTKGLDQAQAGIAVMKLLLENIHLAEEEVNEFLGSLVGLTGEEFADLDLEDSFAIIEQFKNIKGLDVFFKSASKQASKK